MFNPKQKLSDVGYGMHESLSSFPFRDHGEARVSVVLPTHEGYLLLCQMGDSFCLPSTLLLPGRVLLSCPQQAIQECFKRISPQEVLMTHAEMHAKSLGMQSVVGGDVNILVSAPAKRMPALHGQYFSRKVLCENPQNFGPCVQVALFALQWLQFVPQASSEAVAA